MPNSYFRFKEFTIQQDRCAMKVTTDACLFGAWVTHQLNKEFNSRKLNVLDVGTGTGLLALMLAQKLEARITAVEIDRPAFEQATENINTTPWKNDIRLLHGNIKEMVFPQPFDVIIANPPFYENEWQSGDDQKNTAHHGSELLLAGLLEVLKRNLHTDGCFFLLLPYKRRKYMGQLLKSTNAAITEMMLVRQTETHDFFRIMVKARFGSGESLQTSELAIRDQTNQYSPAFTSLLKDYYLYL